MPKVKTNDTGTSLKAPKRILSSAQSNLKSLSSGKVVGTISDEEDNNNEIIAPKIVQESSQLVSTLETNDSLENTKLSMSLIGIRILQ